MVLFCKSAVAIGVKSTCRQEVSTKSMGSIRHLGSEMCMRRINVGGIHLPAQIAYMVGEFPVLSETFVYREIQMLQRLGVDISLIALRRNESKIEVDLDQLPSAMAIYGVSPAHWLLDMVKMLVRRPKNFSLALGYLISDMAQMPTVRQKIKLLGQFVASARLAAQLQKKQIMHLHIHFIHSPCQVGMYGAVIAGIPYTVTAHANDIFSRGELLLEKASRAKRVITISNFNLNFFQSIGVDRSKVCVIRCLMDFPQVDFETKAHLSKKFVIGSLGRLVAKKGFGTLIRAYAQFVQNYPEIESELQIAGTGPEGESLDSLVASLSLSGRVKFLGALPPSKVFDWMCSLNCFALACEQSKDGDVDGIPVVLMEAMACNIPVITTRISGIPELVINNETGTLVEPGQIPELSESLLSVYKDGERIRSEIEKARRHLQNEFSKEVNLQRLLTCLGDI